MMVESSISVDDLFRSITTKIKESVELFSLVPNEVKLDVWSYWQTASQKLEHVIKKITSDEEASRREYHQLPSDLQDVATHPSTKVLTDAETLKQLVDLASHDSVTSHHQEGVVTEISNVQQRIFTTSDSGCVLANETETDVEYTFIPRINKPRSEENSVADVDGLETSAQSLSYQDDTQKTSSEQESRINPTCDESDVSEIMTNTSEETPTQGHVDSANRKYPKRNRKSKKDNIYAYLDLRSDDVTSRTNKENQTTSKGQKTEDGGVTCNVCGVHLARASSLIVHSRQHTGSRPFVCSICGQQFTTKANKIRHENTHKGIKPYKCTECHKSFGEKKTLQIHLLTHSGEKPHKCNVCGMSFAQKGTLRHHMFRHTGLKNFLCPKCGKTFRQKSQMMNHLRRHDESAMFKCDVCSKAFYTKSDLVRHSKKHSSVKPYACDLCPKSYTRMQYLKEHQNFHKGVKPYKCKSCDKAFYESAALYRHTRSHLRKEAETENIEQTQIIEQPQEVEQTILITSDDTLPTVTTNEYGEVFKITYIDQSNMIQIQSCEEADFSAINLLANATTQLTNDT